MSQTPNDHPDEDQLASMEEESPAVAADPELDTAVSAPAPDEATTPPDAHSTSDEISRGL